MSVLNTISNTHIRKLDHVIDEIRLRSLNNVISKLDLGYGCNCNAVKKELLLKLLKWFSFDPVIEHEKVLDLMIKLVKADGGSYLNSFGRIRFQNELRSLRTKVNSKFHNKVNLLEEIASNPNKSIQNYEMVTQKELPDNGHIVPDIQRLGQEKKNKKKKEPPESIMDSQQEGNLQEQLGPNFVSLLDDSMSFELTVNGGDEVVVPKKTGSSVKWLVMPWQVLAYTDKGIMLKVENSLSNSNETFLKIQSCQFITNIMLQDFPAEVFLHRPTTVNILLGLLQLHKNEQDFESQNLIITILKTMYKLTRSLRFRIYYYCDPSIAHKAQKILARNLENEDCAILQRRDSPEGEYPDQNYKSRPYQTERQNNRSPSLIDDSDDETLQMQQMSIPQYCTETLINVIKLLSIPNDSTRPLKIVRYIADLVYELVQLLITSVRPTVWFCNDSIALKIHENMKTLLELLSEILDHLSQFENVDFHRITYIYFLWISVKLISNVLPLELADQVLPKRMKLSICSALMDAPTYLVFPSMHITLQEYARRFLGTQECNTIKLLDDTRLVVKSMKASICLIKNSKEQSYSDDLKMIYSSKLSLLYHKNFKIIHKFINLSQNRSGCPLSKEDKETTTKMMLVLLSHTDIETQEATYRECYTLIKTVLGNEYHCRYSWKNLLFIMESSILIEVICHGTTSENEKIREMATDILLFLLKSEDKMDESGWLRFLEVLIPVLPILQCLSHPKTALGKAITKILDPDLSSTMQIPFTEVLKGNIRLLFSSNSDVREEAVCRLLWLLGQEKDSSHKLPSLSSLHGHHLSSLCVFEKQTSAKRSEGTYQKNTLISVLEMLQTSNVDPKMRKSALSQISVMLSDTSLHKLFLSENGLPLVLDIFSKALTEKDYINYPDSVLPILTILKLLVTTEGSARIELSNRIDVYYNILRSLLLYFNNENVKLDAAQLFVFLLYNQYIIRLTDSGVNNPFNISLPHLIMINMRLPFTCKTHWKTSTHRRSDISILHRNNPVIMKFVRQFWAWEWNGGEKLLWKKWQDINDSSITENLMIKESELAHLTFTSIHFCTLQQLYNIQNSITHNGVLNGIDFLIMYLKLSSTMDNDNFGNLLQLPWGNTFERFLQSRPVSKEDHELFINVLNFLYLYVKILRGEKTFWLHKTVKNMIKSLSDWLNGTEDGCEDVHQSLLRLVRICCVSDTVENDQPDTVWISFVQFAVSNLIYGEYYNMAFLDWMLSTLTYVIRKCQWKNHKETLMAVGNALIELILSFHREGTYSFMGLTITRDCIICLNHVLYQMQINLNKNMWMKFWYGEGQALQWVPALWRSRDPLVRASALQLLANLIHGPHTAIQLLNAIDLPPAELCHLLLYFITTQEESCIVKEEACLAMSHLVKNSNSIVFQYVDALKPRAMLSYVKENNLYHKVAVMCSNLYMLATLDTDQLENYESEEVPTLTLTSSRSNSVSMVPRTIYYLYDCADDFQRYSAQNSNISDSEDQLQFVTTPSLVTSLCLLLNNLISIGKHETIHEIFEHSLHKYLIDCFGDIPKIVSGEKNIEHCHSILEMYTSLCTVLTNCIIHSLDFASIVSFSSKFICYLFGLVNENLYPTSTEKQIFLRNRLITEIFKFLVSLSLTDNQHFDAIQTALESCGTETLMRTIDDIVKSCKSDLGYSALGFLTFLLSLEMQKEYNENKKKKLIEVLDIKQIIKSSTCWSNESKTLFTNANKLFMKSSLGVDSIEHPVDKSKIVTVKDGASIGSSICNTLINLYVALNHVKLSKKSKQTNDKDVVTIALTNLLCVSKEAKKQAISEHFPESCMLILKEMYVNLNTTPIQVFKSQIGRTQKMHPLLHEIESIYLMLMNFMYDSSKAKEIFAKVGLADVIHKLWAYTSMNKKITTTSLKLISTFTSNCSEASTSLALTTVTPGIGLRKTPNSVSILHVIIQIILKEIDMISQNCDSQKLSSAFYILRNAIHSHECRVVISKSNLLQFFTKIHPSSTKRTKLWQIVEINCLEFLMDFTFYSEGQLSVSKATDSLEVLINLARTSSGNTRLLSMSTLRNLAFNITNRPRLLSSNAFLEMLSFSLKEGTPTDIEIAGSTLWSLVSNNQKGKLIARSIGFMQLIQTAISRLSLLSSGKETQELVKMLEYILQIINPP